MPEGEHFTPEMLDRDEHPHDVRHRRERLQALQGQFRKKPVVIDAFQWTGNFDALDAWLDSIGEDDQDGEQAMEVAPDGTTLLIATLEDYERKHAASLNDVVIRGVAGEFYACKPDIFAATYEPVEAASPASVEWSETPQDDEIARLKMDLVTETTMHAAWRKRAEECERGTPVDPALLEPFLKHMREVTIPAIVEAVYQRQRAAAIKYPPLRSVSSSCGAASPPELQVRSTCAAHGPFDPRCVTCPQCLQASSLKRLDCGAASQELKP